MPAGCYALLGLVAWCGGRAEARADEPPAVPCGQLEPETLTAYNDALEEALAAVDASDWDRAIASLEQARTHCADDPRIDLRLAQWHLAAGRCEEAMRGFELAERRSQGADDEASVEVARLAAEQLQELRTRCLPGVEVMVTCPSDVHVVLAGTRGVCPLVARVLPGRWKLTGLDDAQRPFAFDVDVPKQSTTIALALVARDQTIAPIELACAGEGAHLVVDSAHALGTPPRTIACPARVTLMATTGADMDRMEVAGRARAFWNPEVPLHLGFVQEQVSSEVPWWLLSQGMMLTLAGASTHTWAIGQSGESAQSGYGAATTLYAAGAASLVAALVIELLE